MADMENTRTPAVPAQGPAASESETRTRFDAGVEYLLEIYYGTKPLARKRNSPTAQRVERFVAASSSNAAIAKAGSSGASSSANATLPKEKGNTERHVSFDIGAPTSPNNHELSSEEENDEEIQINPEQPGPENLASAAFQPSTPAWTLTILKLQRTTIENCWTGDWHTTLDLAQPPTLRTYQTYLEHQEILGSLSLAYISFLVLNKDRHLRDNMRYLAKRKSPDDEEPIVDAIRSSLKKVETHLTKVLDDRLVDLTRTTAKMILRNVWLSRQGRKLRRLLKELAESIEELENRTKEILSHLADVKPALVFLWGVKAMREALPIWWSLTHGQPSDVDGDSEVPDSRDDEYNLPSEVLNEVSQGLIWLELVLKEFVATCVQHRKKLKVFREVQLSGWASEWIDSDDEEMAPDPKGDEASVRRECEAWMEKRCGEIRALCDTLESYHNAVKDAYQIFGTFREQRMSEPGEFDQPLFSDDGA